MNGTKSTTARGRGRGRGRGGRGRGRGRGRGKKVPKVISSDEEETQNEEPQAKEAPPVVAVEAPVVAVEPKEEKEANIENEPPKLEVPADISQLEAPVFTTIQRGPPEPMLRLDWTHKATLIGEKVLNPMIYCCELCSKPILIYGRMIPCKHVFCLLCARDDHPNCPRCRDKIVRVEQAGLGSVFMCTHAGTRYGKTGCRRTYLSQRDLQAHVKHRHMPPSETTRAEPPPAPLPVPPPLQPTPEPIKAVPVVPVVAASSADPRAAAAARRSNLITVPIQDYTPPQPVPPPFPPTTTPTDVTVPPPQYYGPYNAQPRPVWPGQPYYR